LLHFVCKMPVSRISIVSIVPIVQMICSFIFQDFIFSSFISI